MDNRLHNVKKRIEHWKVISLLLMEYDFLSVLIAYFAALWIRFDCRYSSIEPQYLQGYFHSILTYALFCVLTFWILRLYKSIWRFASYTELLRMILATVITGLSYIVCMAVFVMRMPVSYF